MTSKRTAVEDCQTSEFAGDKFDGTFVHPSRELPDERQREWVLGRKDNCDGANETATVGPV